MDALKRFRSEFRGWVSVFNRTKGYNASPDEVLKRLESRMPETKLRQIGAAFINGWLINEDDPSRGYFVKESDRKGLRGGQWTLEPAGGSKINPCWELHVQFADYGRLKTIAEPHGLTVRLEDRLMDITVYAGRKLLLYVENKQRKGEALHLLEKMREYGRTGFHLDDSDIGNDPLKKAKYLVRDMAHPIYFALSAINFEKVFRVEYLKGKNRFLIHDADLTLIEPLLDAVPAGKTTSRSIIDPLALEIERLARDRIWVSLGSGKTAFNFYVPSSGGDTIVLGVYDDGRIWTDVKGLGEEKARCLANELKSIGVKIDISKQWTFWKKNHQAFILSDEDPVNIAKQVVAAVL